MTSRSDSAAGKKLPLYKRGRSPQETIEVYSMPVPECGCWIWMGAAGRYGQVKRHKRLMHASRLSWLAFRGPLLETDHVLHKCDTPLCVNPDHLFLGNPLINARDKEAKGRGGHPSGKRWHEARLRNV